MRIKKMVMTLFLSLATMAGVADVNAQAITVTGVRSAYRTADNMRIDYDVDNAKGILKICVSGTENDISLKITKNDKSYFYRLSPGEMAVLPLNMGNGEYTLEASLYITATSGEAVWSDNIEVELENELSPYLNASIIVNWSWDQAFVAKAQSLADKLDEKSTALAICSFIANKYTYDNPYPPPGYIPDLDKVYAGDSGICYDFAVLYTAMCRSVGIACKLVMGYSNYLGMGKYHAWCQVYIDKQWYMVDPTYSIEKGSSFLDASNTVETRYY